MKKTISFLVLMLLASVAYSQAVVDSSAHAVMDSAGYSSTVLQFEGYATFDNDTNEELYRVESLMVAIIPSDFSIITIHEEDVTNLYYRVGNIYFLPVEDQNDEFYTSFNVIEKETGLKMKIIISEEDIVLLFEDKYEIYTPNLKYL